MSLSIIMMTGHHSLAASGNVVTPQRLPRYDKTAESFSANINLAAAIIAAR